MGFLFYITDFWYWRWRDVLALIRSRSLSHTVLQTYYVNFYFVIADTPPLRRLAALIERWA
ncbi:MAG: hypothetical protein ACK42Y_05740 [Candidatus Thermochlorobacter sp.]